MTSVPVVRIAVISPRYAPDIGGVEQNVEKTASGMVARGTEVDVLTTDPTGRLARRERLDGVDVRRFPTLGGDTVYFVAPRLFRWLYRHAAEYDLVHAHSYHTALAVGAALVSRLRRVPFVVTAHYHGTGHTPFRRAVHVAYRPFGQWMLRQADVVVANSTAEADLLHTDVGPDLPVAIVAPGIDLGEAGEAAPVERVPGHRYLLAVGRLEPYKQTVCVVEALAKLPPEYELVVIGQGPARGAVEQAVARLGLSGRVRLLGSVPREILLGWFQSADALVTISQHEAFGLVVAEAAVAGTRVVASDIPAHREVAGYLPAGQVELVPADTSAASLAAVLQRTAGMGRTAPQRGSIPTWDDTATNLLAVYRSILEPRAVVGDRRPGNP